MIFFRGRPRQRRGGWGGGTTKRTCDNAVAYGQDVESLEKMVALVVERCPSIFYSIVKEDDIRKIDSVKIPESKKITGTLQIHYWRWVKEKPLEITFKKLMCLKCSGDVDKCSHYSLGRSPWSISQTRPPVSQNRGCRGRK